MKKLILVSTLSLSIFTISAFAQFDASQYKNPQTAIICNTLIQNIESSGGYPNNKLIDSSNLSGNMILCTIKSTISTGFGLNRIVNYTINYNKEKDSYAIELKNQNIKWFDSSD